MPELVDIDALRSEARSWGHGHHTLPNLVWADVARDRVLALCDEVWRLRRELGRSHQQEGQPNV